MKIPFDIKFRPQIESGEYEVVTRSGKPARIVCWDMNDDVYPIVALVSDDSFRERANSYTILGCYIFDVDSNSDLFLITPDESEESESEVLEDEGIRKGLVNFILYKAGHLLDEETEHEFIAYLEKQKVKKED